MLRYFILILLFPMMAYGDNKFQFFTIGTGGITGVYYSAGNAICKLVNKNFIKHKMRCAVESTAGSAFNVRAVRNEDVVFGLVQAGVHYNSYNGISTFSSESPYQSMRSLFSLHDEVFTLIANPALNINTVEELAKKRIAIGPVGSGTRIGAKQLLSLAGYKDSDFAVLSDLKVDQNTSALCANTIDAYIYMVGQPARNTKESTSRCQGVLLSITGEAAKGLDAIPYFSKYRIPGGLYKNNPNDINTYSVRATLVTDEDTPDTVVYHLVKAVFEDLDAFIKMHPAFSRLDMKSMIKQGLTAPLHNGAKKYYKERGLL